MHWTHFLAPVEAPDPFANKCPVSPWPKLNIPTKQQGYW